MAFLRKTIEWMVEKLKMAGALCLVSMMALTCVDVVGRLFRHPIFGSVEIVGFLATMSVAMALPYTHKIDGHVGVELVVRLLSKKTQLIIDLITRLLSLALFMLATWRLAVYAHTLQASGEVSMNLEFPEYTVVYVVAFCSLVFSLVIGQDVVTYIKELKKK